LSVDEQPLDAGALDTAIPVDPGPHTVVVTAPGRDRATARIDIKEGQLLTVKLAEPRPLPPVVDNPSPGPKDASSTQKPAPVWPLITMLSLGAVAGGTFGYFAWSGRGAKNDLDKCKPNCTETQADRVRSKYLVGDIFLGVSLLSFGAAAVYYFVTRPSRTGTKAAWGHAPLTW
jgi:hypothetical protein